MKKYTIEDLREGRVAIRYEGNLEKLQKVIKKAFPYYTIVPYGINNYYYSSSHPHYWSSGNTKPELPTVSELEFDLEPEMIEGQYYYVEEGTYWMIGKCMGKFSKEGSIYRSLSINISKDMSYNKERLWCYKDLTRTFRPATQEEINWLDACIKNEKYLTKEEAMKDNIKYITFTPEQQQATINMACSTWKDILAHEFGATIVLGKNIEIPEKRFKQYLEASTKEQKEKFQEMFPDYFNPRPDIKQGQLIYVRDHSAYEWRMRFFKRWACNKVECYQGQSKSGGTSYWTYYSVENPLENN